MRCPQCGAESASGKRFCADCGASLPVRCPKCDAESLSAPYMGSGEERGGPDESAPAR
jgi:predicted amidophosphoribosyltransferase